MPAEVLVELGQHLLVPVEEQPELEQHWQHWQLPVDLQHLERPAYAAQWASTPQRPGLPSLSCFDIAQETRVPWVAMRCSGIPGTAWALEMTDRASLGRRLGARSGCSSIPGPPPGRSK